MKHVMTRGFPLYWCLFFACCTAGYGEAAVVPDSHIQSTLQRLFVDSPQVSGYPYQEAFAAAADRYGLPLPLVLAVARGESFFEPTVESVKGAVGIMQVLPATASEYGLKPDDLLDPKKNIDVGVHYLADLYAQFEDPYLTLGAYYCGGGSVEKGSFTLYKECDEYVRYIYSHLRRILAWPEGTGAGPTGGVHHFVLARFDNFLDAENFLGVLSEKVPNLQFDLFRSEVVRPDHTRFQYQILAAVGQGNEKDAVCLKVQEKTGFSFCW